MLSVNYLINFSICSLEQKQNSLLLYSAEDSGFPGCRLSYLCNCMMYYYYENWLGVLNYRRSTIFHCHLIFMGRRKNENIQHNTKQWYRNAFSGPKLDDEQLKHRNIMNEILWIYGTSLYPYQLVYIYIIVDTSRVA